MCCSWSLWHVSARHHYFGFVIIDGVKLWLLGNSAIVIKWFTRAVFKKISSMVWYQSFNRATPLLVVHVSRECLACRHARMAFSFPPIKYTHSPNQSSRLCPSRRDQSVYHPLACALHTYFALCPCPRPQKKSYKTKRLFKPIKSSDEEVCWRESKYTPQCDHLLQTNYTHRSEQNQ